MAKVCPGPSLLDPLRLGIARWAAQLPAAEGELLLCRACLCTLCLSPQMVGGPSASPNASGVARVRALLNHVGEERRAGSAPCLDPAAPLGNFVHLLLDALDRRNPLMLTWLVAQYEARLRDPALHKYVDVVQQRLGLELAATTAGSVPPPTPTASHGQPPSGLAMPSTESTSTIDDND